MALAPPPAMRIKSSWFRPGEARAPEEQAGAMAFIVFRVGRQMLERMRSADFDIHIGTPYFGFLAEALVLLVHTTDRLALARLEPEARVAFTTALAHHVARHLAENLNEYAAPPPAGEPSYEDRFIDRLNAVSPDYAEADGVAAAAPDSVPALPVFALARLFATRLEPLLPAKDRPWILDQVTTVEVPEALEILQRAMQQLHDPQPRRARRAAMSGE